MSRTSALFRAFLRIIESLPPLEEWPAIVQRFVLYKFLPFGLILLALLTFFQLLRIIKNAFTPPPSASQLHQDALLVCRSQPKAAIDLLQRAIQQNPHYLPPYLSLATLYLYQLEQATKAKQILMQAKQSHTSADLDQLLEDANAYQHNPNMIHINSAFRIQEHLQIRKPR